MAKIPNKREPQEIAKNHSSDINPKISLISTENVLLNHIIF